MRSYALAVAFSVLLSAVYAFQNPGDITVRFLLWSREVPQGVWEAAVFAAGCVLMWIVSISAFIEQRTRYRQQIKEQETKVKKLEEERRELLRSAPKTPEQTAHHADAENPEDRVEQNPTEVVKEDPLTTEPLTPSSEDGDGELLP
jgi:uncharacterized integral membrane protein